jgi:putative transposase
MAIGLKKAIHTIKKIEDYQKTSYTKSQERLSRAIETDSLIGISQTQRIAEPREERKRKQEKKGKFNRKLSGFPYFKFTEYLTYKAALAGIKVIKIFEDWTSQTCRKCNQRGTRRTQGLFTCKTCGEENADRNISFISLTGLWDIFLKYVYHVFLSTY